MRHALLLGLVLAASPLAGAQPALPKDLPKSVVRPAMFKTDDEFVRWTHAYASDPRPDLLDEAFRFFLDSKLSRDPAKRVELAAFFGGALARTPAMAPAVRDAALRDRSYDSLFALVNALWLADSDECRDVLRALAAQESDERVKEFITRRIQAASPIAEGKSVDSLSQIQLLWARFDATADPEIPARIAAIIVTRYETSPEATLFQQAAENSIRDRADRPAVREGLRRAIERADDSPLKEDARQLLKELSEQSAGQPGPSPTP